MAIKSCGNKRQMGQVEYPVCIFHFSHHQLSKVHKITIDVFFSTSCDYTELGRPLARGQTDGKSISGLVGVGGGQSKDERERERAVFQYVRRRGGKHRQRDG